MPVRKPPSPFRRFNSSPKVIRLVVMSRPHRVESGCCYFPPGDDHPAARTNQLRKPVSSDGSPFQVKGGDGT